VAKVKADNRDTEEVSGSPGTLEPVARPRLTDLPDVLSGEEVAQLVGVSTETVRRWHADGEIPGRAVGRKLFFLKSRVIAWLEGS
jgi:excisionase family DNA binding protein